MATTIDDIDWELMSKPLKSLNSCNICPRQCNANRFSENLGYCRTDAGFNISAICIHKGEEPAISGEKGICNIFFPHCNLQCIYCQNIQISKNSKEAIFTQLSLKKVIEKILIILDQGINAIGFVSPTHNIPHVKIIINVLRKLGRNPVFIYNTNAYDNEKVLRSLEGLIDIYLPDFKYIDNQIAQMYSNAENYPEIAKKAIKEMYYQKGSSLLKDDFGSALSGLIIRHLVLPGHIDQSIQILKYISEEISQSVHVSIMAQYYPIENVKNHPIISRTITKNEYNQVLSAIENFGLYNGWFQEMESSNYYKPDFTKENPF